MTATAALRATAGPNALHPGLAGGLELQVAGVDAQTPSITSIRFTDPAGSPLPTYVPGSHLLIRCGDGVNAYSLTDSGRSPSDYSVSVLRVASGAGGSAAMHRLRVGDRVTVSHPRSAFAPLATARHQLLVAGGIGVTPMLSHARAAAERGTPASMLYTYRAGEGAHLPELRERKGVCGESSIPVLRGTPQHRDLYLGEDQKAAGRTMMCCVSRSLDQELELDL